MDTTLEEDMTWLFNELGKKKSRDESSSPRAFYRRARKWYDVVGLGGEVLYEHVSMTDAQAYNKRICGAYIRDHRPTPVLAGA